MDGWITVVVLPPALSLSLSCYVDTEVILCRAVQDLHAQDLSRKPIVGGDIVASTTCAALWREQTSRGEADMLGTVAGRPSDPKDMQHCSEAGTQFRISPIS